MLKKKGKKKVPPRGSPPVGIKYNLNALSNLQMKRIRMQSSFAPRPKMLFNLK